MHNRAAAHAAKLGVSCESRAEIKPFEPVHAYLFCVLEISLAHPKYILAGMSIDQPHPRVYSYIRFSDAKQAAGASTERQQSYAADWAKKHGLELDESLTMRDEGLSAYHQMHVKRGALGLFLAAVDAGAVPSGSVLVVEGLDRLSRAEPIQAQAQLANIINAGVSVVTASDGKVYSRESLKANPMDLVYSLLVMIRAHEESDTKSKRVRDAIRRQCLGWQTGAYRGLVRYGPAPSWLKAVDGVWQVIPERQQAVLTAIELWQQGLGTGAIANALFERGLSISSVPPTSGHLSRLLQHPALAGTKIVNLDGEEFVLHNYYPALISQELLLELQQQGSERGRRWVKGDIPSILTGHNITVCGYCGSPMKSQTMTSRRNADGTIPDYNRRLHCMRINSGHKCGVAGSCSAVPVEKALMHHCSDLINMQRLFNSDHTAVAKSAVTAAQAEVAKVQKQLDRITEALLESTDAPTTFLVKAKELELLRDQAQNRLLAAERDLANISRAGAKDAHLQWREIAHGVLSLDKAARLKARQLVADTFERITVYQKGMRPAAGDGRIDIVLLARSGQSRLLRIDRTGNWVAGEDVDLMG